MSWGEEQEEQFEIENVKWEMVKEKQEEKREEYRSMGKKKKPGMRDSQAGNIFCYLRSSIFFVASVFPLTFNL